MNGLRTNAITTLHQAETGAPACIARIVQTATAPNEGQRFLQGDLHDNTIERESRERTSTTTNAAGNVTTERLVESSVVLEDGRSVHVQQAQQQVVAQVCDNNILLAAINQGQSLVREFKDTVMDKIAEELEKEIAAREQGLAKESAARELAFIALELSKNAALEKRLTDLERGCSSNKKPRNADKLVIKQRHNIISWTLRDITIFSWSKMVQGVTRSKKGFASAEEAKADMEHAYAAEAGMVP